MLTLEIIKNLSDNTLFDLYHNSNSNEIRNLILPECNKRKIFDFSEDEDMIIPSIDSCYDCNGRY